MTYVADTVDGFLRVAAADGVEGEVFNVGSGVGRTVAEMLDAVQRVVGVDKPVEQVEARLRPAKSEVAALVCDFRKAQKAFGYEPRTEFEDGLVRLRDHLVERSSPADVAVYHV
jgi:UDP-glucose 4-epimerase